MLLLKEIAIY